MPLRKQPASVAAARTTTNVSNSNTVAFAASFVEPVRDSQEWLRYRQPEPANTQRDFLIERATVPKPSGPGGEFGATPAADPGTAKATANHKESATYKVAPGCPTLQKCGYARRTRILCRNLAARHPLPPSKVPAAKATNPFRISKSCGKKAKNEPRQSHSPFETRPGSQPILALTPRQGREATKATREVETSLQLTAPARAVILPRNPEALRPFSHACAVGLRHSPGGNNGLL